MPLFLFFVFVLCCITLLRTNRQNQCTGLTGSQTRHCRVAFLVIIRHNVAGSPVAGTLAVCVARTFRRLVLRGRALRVDLADTVGVGTSGDTLVSTGVADRVILAYAIAMR